MIGIRVNPTVSSLNTLEYFSTKQEYNTISSGILSASDCSLCLKGCTKDIPVRAFLADPDDEYKNDFRSFIYYTPSFVTITANLIKVDQYGNETSYAFSNTYGQLYSVGTLKANVWGFILDWYKVANVLGFGKYKTYIKMDLFGKRVFLEKTSPCYDLKPWDCNSTHRTMRLTTYQSGYIENGFDYRDMTVEYKDTKLQGWPQQFRWYGKLRAVIPTFIEDNIVDTRRNSRQIQAHIYNNYELRFYHIQMNLMKPFLKDQLLANQIYIDDYNINNQEVYKKVRVKPVDIFDRKTYNLNKNEHWGINFEDYNKSTLKRN